MTRFRFCLIGVAQHPIVDVAVADIADLHRMMTQSRFIEGRLADDIGETESVEVAIAVSRIQMVVTLAA